MLHKTAPALFYLAYLWAQLKYRMSWSVFKDAFQVFAEKYSQFYKAFHKTFLSNFTEAITSMYCSHVFIYLKKYNYLLCY